MTEPKILDDLTPAMMTMESDVDLPTGIRPSSILGNLLALKPGEIYTYGQEMPSDMSLAQLQAAAPGLRFKIRNAVASSIRNAKKMHDHGFSLETAMVQYPSGCVFVQVVVRCVAGTPVVDDDEV